MACIPRAALSLMILEDGPLFIADTQINAVPTAEQIAETVIGAVRHAKRFGVDAEGGAVQPLQLWQP